ncbi:MAG: nitronate monooxygenase [Alphaproteobacteria bacterium]|nr:nitronate monooxygenase [Alphaproteobacteria bacterium]
MDFDQLLGASPLCRRLGIAYPIIQAGMGQVAYGALAGAVSAAGGLGVIGSGYLSGEELRREIRIVREITDKPFGVDILFAKAEAGDPTSVRYTRQVTDQINVTLEERVPVLISGLGNPLGVIAEAHAAGMIVMSVVGNVQQARKLERDGVDMIIASGADGGGHVGRVGTIALVPAVAAAVKVPVVAGGGIASGRGLVAALALGAAGVWMGTRFIASAEARAHANYKAMIVDANDESTIVSRALSSKPTRLLVNDFTRYWERHPEEIQPFPLQLEKVGAPASVRGRIEGDVANGALPAGQSVAMISSVKPVAEIIADIRAEARGCLERLYSGGVSAV